MHKKEYIQATYKILEEKDDLQKTLDALTRSLKKRGLLKLYPSILRGLLEKIQKNQRIAHPVVTVARESDYKKYAKKIKSLAHIFDLEKVPEVQIDKSIIGGFTIKEKSIYLDESYKSKLLHVYHRLAD